jgi:hypothetical protein
MAKKESAMDPTYKKIEVVGTSGESFARAVSNAVGKASKTLHGLNWFEVTEMRGRIEGGKVIQYQVSVKLGMKLD